MIAELIAIIAIAAARLRLHRRSTVDSMIADEYADPTVARARALVEWASGSRLDWDRHVRPVLARELAELTRGRPADHLLGPELWPLVDPGHTFDAPDEPGPGHAGLTRVLDRLERL
jgi:hypothetical protein